MSHDAAHWVFWPDASRASPAIENDERVVQWGKLVKHRTDDWLKVSAEVSTDFACRTAARRELLRRKVMGGGK